VDVTVIGLGLIGGSLLRALDAAGHRVTGFDADPDTRKAVAEAGFTVAASIRETAGDLVVLAVPLPALPEVLDELKGYGGLVTDVVSVKGPVRDLAVEFGLRRFVGGHPMAGKETSGFAATDPGLFDGCAWVLCLETEPGTGRTALGDWLTLAALFTGIGARVVPATAAEHDRAVAEVSHVPHLLAAALALQLDGNPLAAALAAGSFRDGTRVAQTRPELTAAMCGGNATAVRETLHELIGILERMDDELNADDPIGALTPTLSLGGRLRRAWPPKPGKAGREAAQETSLLNLGRGGGWVTGVAENLATVSTMRTETGRI
jgi:prephenate dehydrogenase